MSLLSTHFYLIIVFHLLHVSICDWVLFNISVYLLLRICLLPLMEHILCESTSRVCVGPLLVCCCCNNSKLYKVKPDFRRKRRPLQTALTLEGVIREGPDWTLWKRIEVIFNLPIGCWGLEIL